MRGFMADRWKAGRAIASTLLLLVLIVWVPVSAVGAHERPSGLATLAMGTAQATPTEDATVTALNKEKLAQEVDQLKNQNYWAWTTIGSILVGFAGLLAALYSFITWIRNRQDEQKKRDEEQQRWLDDRQAERERRDEEQQRWLEDQKAEREKRAEERFQAVVAGLSSEREEAKVGAAITLRTFLRPGYEQFYSQAFDLAVAHLRLPRTSPPSEDPDGIPHSPENPNIPLPLTTLRQALIVVFKEAFPLVRDMVKKQDAQFRPESLDARGIQLDSAYLDKADLKQVFMQRASLRKVRLRKTDLSGANLIRADLSDANLSDANLSGAYLGATKLRRVILNMADLSGAFLTEADLSGANLSDADLSGAHFSSVNLGGADLSRADVTEANLEEALSLKDTNLRGVNGLTKEQLEACKAKGALIDEDSRAIAFQSPISPPLPSQSNYVQVPPASPAQGSTLPPDTGSSAASSKSSPQV